jgi:putative ABC transport system permease protein
MTLAGIAAAMALLVGTLFAFDSIDDMIDTIYYRTDVYDASVVFVEAQNQSALHEIERLPGVIAAEPRRDVYVRFHNGAISELASLTGLMREAQTKQLLDQDDQHVPVSEFGLTLSSQLAKMLDVGLGERVMIEVLEGRRPVTSTPVTAIIEESIGATAYMEITEVNRLMREGGAMTGVFVRLDPDQAGAFNAAILERPKVASVSLRSAAIDTFQETLEETVTIMMTIYALIGGAIAAGVVYNAARISLTECGRELASLRVLGFTRGEAAYILLGELALLSIAATPVGAVLGAGFAHLIVIGMSTELYRVPYALLPSTRGLAAAIVLIAAAGAAVLVAQRVRDLDLIEVLKTRE